MKDKNFVFRGRKAIDMTKEELCDALEATITFQEVILDAANTYVCITQPIADNIVVTLKMKGKIEKEYE